MTLNPFTPRPLKGILQDDLYDAERQALIAANQSEHWQATHDMFQKRIDRLRAALDVLKFQTTQGEER